MRTTLIGSMDAVSGACSIGSSREGHWNIISLEELVQSLELIPADYKDLLRIKVKKAQLKFGHFQDYLNSAEGDPAPPIIGMATMVFARRPEGSPAPANASNRASTYCSIEKYFSEVVYPASSMAGNILVGQTKHRIRKQEALYKPSDSTIKRWTQTTTLLSQDITKLLSKLIQDMGNDGPITDYQFHIFWNTGPAAHDGVSDDDGYPIETNKISSWSLVLDYELVPKK